jgi:hypothetical protein
LLGAPAVSCLQIDGVWKISVGARRRTTDADHLKSLLFSKKKSLFASIYLLITTEYMVKVNGRKLIGRY